MKPEKKREFETRVVCEMIDLYYKKHPNPKEQEELTAYAKLRISKCPFMESKSFRSHCKVHCYRNEKREQIRQVMRYAGPRMLLRHPLMTLRHLWLDHQAQIEKPLFLLIGFIGLFLCILGAILPLLPAFPFALLAAWGFARSSEKLHTKFINSRLYKDNAKDWVETRSMKKSAKIRVLTTISVVMLIGFIMMRRVPIGQFILVLVWIGHVLYFRYGMKTMPEEHETPARIAPTARNAADSGVL